MNAEAVSTVAQLTEQITLFRDRLSRQTPVKALLVTYQCNMILADLEYLKPRAVLNALSLEDTTIHDLATALLAEWVCTPDRLKRTILIDLLMDIPAEHYQPQLANRLNRQPPSHIPEGVSEMNATQRARSILTARQFLRGLLIVDNSGPGS